jgi:hypothetical protein
MSGKSMSTSNPAVVNVISNIVNPFGNVTPYILNMVKALFGNPPTDWISGFSSLFPFCPFFSSAALYLSGTTDPISKF